MKFAYLYPQLKALAASGLLSIAFTSNAQIMESRAIDRKAPESPEWMIKAAGADDFREPETAIPVETMPYANSTAGAAVTTGPIRHQPVGALTGKVVFAMAGHGWTYDADKMYYYTQRGLSNGMVEDLGNADQMHIFAHMAFNAGATVVPFRPVDHQPEERVIDNTMPQVELFGEWKEGASDRYFGPAQAKVKYVTAKANLQETAIARFRPYIPKAGYYPVYVWARDGADRSNQLYRIAYGGGIAEVRVNWRRVGKTWTWLGTYYFEPGLSGYVETSNQVIDPYEAYNGHVVIADAVRFGNGHGDVPRPAGVSGYSREDEGDSYWIEQALGNNADRRIFDAGSDGNSTVSSPPKAAAHTNRESEGSFLDRVLISFHSNASTGKARGAIALYNAKAEQRPTYQEGLAEIIGQEINRQLGKEPPPPGIEWPDRERNTYSGINFGELRRDYLQNEMCATIVETAFHDNAVDAAFMLDPVSRMRMAQATFRGLLLWYSEVVNPNSVQMLPPPRPSAVAATRTKNAKISVAWKLGPTGEFDGGPAANIRVYRSPNGYGFDGGIPVSADAKAFEVEPLTTTGTTFIRVTASNAAGESLPSTTIAIGLAESSKKIPGTLLISANNILDSSTNIPYFLGGQPGGPYRETAYTERVRPIYNIMEPAGRAEALALGLLNTPFEGADSAAIESGLVDPTNYKRVFICAGTQNPKTPLLSDKLLGQLRSALNKNSKVYVSGSGIAENLKSHKGTSKSFLSEVLGVTEATSAQSGQFVVSTDSRFYSTTASLELSQYSTFWRSQELIKPASYKFRSGRSLALMEHQESPGTAAALLTRPFYSEGEVILMGFPLSLIKSNTDRILLMEAVLHQM